MFYSPCPHEFTDSFLCLATADHVRSNKPPVTGYRLDTQGND